MFPECDSHSVARCLHSFENVVKGMIFFVKSNLRGRPLIIWGGMVRIEKKKLFGGSPGKKFVQGASDKKKSCLVNLILKKLFTFSLLNHVIKKVSSVNFA